MKSISLSEIINSMGTNSFVESAMNEQIIRRRFATERRKRKRWEDIIRTYELSLPRIMAKGARKFTNPYLLHWKRHATPTEWATWEAIRNTGTVVLYPEFPPAPNEIRALIDFANPVLRIGLEIDGSDHDPDKDEERDKRLSNFGWRIFRAPYTMAVAPRDPPERLASELDDVQYQELKDWMFTSIDGLVEAIRIFYFTDEAEYTFTCDKRRELWDCAYQTLDAHRLVDFPLDPDWRLPPNSIYRRDSLLK